MSPLPPPDHHHYNAAAGWLELGNPSEAHRELQRIDPTHREDPEVLELWWRIHAARYDWEAAVAAARRLTQVLPQVPWGWVQLAFALHALRRTAEAWEALHPVAGQFPTHFLMRYNLACYASRLGHLNAAWDWLQQAAALVGARLVKKLARQDPDLKPLRPRLKEL